MDIVEAFILAVLIAINFAALVASGDLRHALWELWLREERPEPYYQKNYVPPVVDFKPPKEPKPVKPPPVIVGGQAMTDEQLEKLFKDRPDLKDQMGR